MPPSSLSARSSEFLRLRSRADLAGWLGLSDKALRFVLYRLPTNRKYETFEIRKRNGGTRTIDAPTESLKALQRQISHALAELSPPRQVAKGYVRGKSIFDHARAHSSRKWVVLVDIQSFFPSIHFGRVRGLFLARPFHFPNELATCLANLCCKDGVLPQGSPSSPAISNIICRQLDRELLVLAKEAKASVTRYADDICFSTNMRHLPSRLVEFVSPHGHVPSTHLTRLIENSGFTLNLDKFGVRGVRDQKMVTGLVVNRGVAVPRIWRRQVRTLMSILRIHGPDKGRAIIDSWKSPIERQKPADSFLQMLKGKISYARWIDKRAGKTFIESLHRNFESLRAHLPRRTPKFPIRIMSEGDSDLLHLQRALRAFAEAGEFNELAPRFLNFAGGNGDAELWHTLQRIAKVDVDELTIGIFDCDNAAFMTKHGLEVGGRMRLGSKVYAICLAQPNVATLPPFCIESLYSRHDATRESLDGRRLFFRDEFDPKTGRSLDGRFTRKFPKAQAVVLSDSVSEAADPQSSVLLGKMEFATLIANSTPPFDHIDFKGFAPTLQLVREVVDEVSLFHN